MRRICVFLCLSLFVSLIHAAGMPMPAPNQGQDHIGHAVQHDCHTQSDVKSGKSQSTNHQAHHQCCLGVIANFSSIQYLQPDYPSHAVALAPQFVIENMPTHIFRPPRQFS